MFNFIATIRLFYSGWTSRNLWRIWCASDRLQLTKSIWKRHLLVLSVGMGHHGLELAGGAQHGRRVVHSFGEFLIYCRRAKSEHWCRAEVLQRDSHLGKLQNVYHFMDGKNNSKISPWSGTLSKQAAYTFHNCFHGKIVRIWFSYTRNKPFEKKVKNPDLASGQR